MMYRFLVGVVAAAAGVFAQDVPKVVSLEPANGSLVDAKTTQLVVAFDKAMDPSGHTICGGGESFPKFLAKPVWRDDRTLVLPVRLKPDNEYELSLNCSSARKIRSREGKQLPPVVWKFTTLPEHVRPAAEQRPRNEAALQRLVTAIRESYGQRDRVVADWSAAFDGARASLLDAPTDRAFAVAASELLGAAEDLQIDVHYRDRDYATFEPIVEPLYRTFAVRRVFPIERVSARVFRAETDDGIGYLLITGWQPNVDPDKLVTALTEMMGHKALILDVRVGDGGREEIARQIASWFVAGEHVYARYRERTGAGGEGDDGFAEPVERRIVGNDVVFGRPVVVLSGPRVTGANEAFVLMMKHAEGCTVVGQTSYGAASEVVRHDLGNGVAVTLPNGQLLRPDGTPVAGNGVPVDVEVPCTSRDFEQRDPPLEKALELLREKIGG